VAYHRPKSTALPASLLVILLACLQGCSTPPSQRDATSATAAASGTPEAPPFSVFTQAEPERAMAEPSTPAPAPSKLTAIPAIEKPRSTTRNTTTHIQTLTNLPTEDVKNSLPIDRALDLTVQPDDLWERLRNGFAMPNLTSPLVLDRQIWYASRPGDIKRMVERSRRYLYHIVQELEKRGMPTELALLPMVESAFNPMAYSRAHASGLWQFIPSTGKSYNLQQNWWYDARRDIIASTNAALDYLQFLYDMHGDWHLALASYNWGENAVARAIARNKAKGEPTDYLSLTMPQETRYYVPKLQALKNIFADPDRFNLSLEAIPNEPYFVTVSIKNMDIRLAAKLAEMPIEELIALNPAHNRPVISLDTLVLPADRAEIFQANLQNHDEPLVSWQAYTLKKGDRLDKLAASHGIALAKLRQANGITARTRVGPGFQLLLPVKGLAAATEPLPRVFTPPAAQSASRTVVRRFVHTVAKGETLTAIAERYDVSVNNLRQWNKIGRLMAGQKLNVEREVTIAATPRRASPRKPAARSANPPKARPAKASSSKAKAKPKAVRG
jgi:membrane-bound lytic murein transglycosylase D